MATGESTKYTFDPHAKYCLAIFEFCRLQLNLAYLRDDNDCTKTDILNSATKVTMRIFKPVPSVILTFPLSGMGLHVRLHVTNRRFDRFPLLYDRYLSLNIPCC